MRKRNQLREKLTYANVMVTILAIVVFGGGVAYGASQLGKNSVGTKQLKKNAVTGAKVKDQSLTGKDIKLSKLGTVPSATTATTATTANGLAAPEPIRLVGTAGQPPFLDGTIDLPFGPPTGEPVGFYKDHEGIVHLEGIAKVGSEVNPVKGLIFQLPPGYRPASGVLAAFPQEEGAIFILGSNTSLVGKNLEGDVVFTGATGTALLSGITFRAQS